MFGTITVENTAFFYEVVSEVTMFHEATLESESFSSGFPLLL